jgi:PAS domain S-box-containing protein
VVFNGAPCLVGMGIDISERKRAEEALRQSEVKLRVIFEQAPLGIAVLDTTTGRFLRLNPQYCKIAGYSEPELMALDFQRITHPDDLRQDLVNMQRLREGSLGAFQIEKRYLRKDGSTVWVHLTCVRLWEFASGEAQHIAMVEDITERRQAEVRRAESERQYRELVELANSIILRWNSEGRVTFLNEFGLRFFGYSATEILGRHVVGSIVPETEAGGRDLRGLMDRICADPAAFERSVNENILRSGERVSIAWTNKILRDEQGQAVEILSVGTDITDRQRAEEALRASEERYHTLFEHAPDGIVIADSESTYLDANASMCRMLGYTRDELIGLHATDIVVPAEVEHIAPALGVIRGRSDYHREWQFRRKDGTVFPAEVIATLMPDGNLMGMIRDITERKRAETALRELNETLEHRVVERTSEMQAAVARAEAADRVKSAFLATMSHELRTPLNSIIGFTGILCQGLAGPLNPEQSKQLGMVRGSARHLLELINDVLDISKIEANQLEVGCLPFDLPASLARVIASVRPLAEKKGLELVSHIHPGLDGMSGDRRRVEQVLLNLLNNAIKFTERGGVTLTAEPVADYQPAPDAAPRPVVRLRVTDTGMGIKPADLASLFQPFRQIDTGLARQHEGTGLGLAICRRLASLMGGEILAASKWSQGSEFTVILPLQKVCQS